MFSLQRLLSKGNPFFDLLTAGADESYRSVQALVELVNTPEDGQGLEKFIASRRQEKHIHEQITSLVCSPFVTPFEREDIEALANALSRITKVTKKFAQRMLLSKPHIATDIFQQQTALLEQAASTLCEMVRQLRHNGGVDRVQEQNNLLHQYEGEADKLMLDLLGQLYNGQYSALQMILIRDLLEMLEKVIDRHRDAGNIIFQIVLKNS
jgi:uncharacterized protein